MNKGIILANKALANPELIKQLDNDTFFKFIIAIAKYDKSLAMKVEALRPFTCSNNKVLFWTAVGILTEELV